MSNESGCLVGKGHVPKKKFGQNFLTVPYYIEKIVDAVPAEDGDVVVEIGPGKGALSRYLVKRDFDYTMVEMDSDVIPILKEELGDREYRIVNGDATEFDYSELGDSYHAVGNLPYNVASHIIKRMLFTVPYLQSGTFMVQKEVAERICATPGGKDIGFLTILCQFFGKTQKLFDVPPGAFFPKPKVVSSVFRIDIDAECYGRLDRNEWSSFFEFVSVGYSMRRKKLSNSIARFANGKSEVEALMESVGIQASIRPEGLSVEDWVKLYKAIKEVKHAEG